MRACTTAARHARSPQHTNDAQVLDVHDNRAGPAGVAALARALVRCRALRHLYLSGSACGGEGIAALAKVGE